MKSASILFLGVAGLLGASATIMAQPVVFGPYGPGGTYNAYQAIITPLSWEDARTNATNRTFQGLRGHLATIGSAAENAHVASVGGPNQVWIGLTDLAPFGGFEESGPPCCGGSGTTQTGAGFVWITGEAKPYQNWASGEPNNFTPGEGAAEIRFDGLWNDNGAGAVYGQGAPAFKSAIEYEVNLPAAYFATANVWRIEVHKASPGVLITNLARADAVMAGSGRAYVAVSYYTEANMEDNGGPGDFGNNPGVVGVREADDFAVRGTGYLMIEVAGSYVFRANSDDGQRVLIDLNGDGDFNDPGESVIVNDVLSGPHNVDSAAIPLAPGVYRIEWTWFERSFGAEGELSASRGGGPFYILGDTAAGGLRVTQDSRPPSSKVAKWSQLPGYLTSTNRNMLGGDRPSDFDWVRLMASNAPPVLDQAYVYTSPPDDREFRLETAFEQAQTFRVGTSGLLSRVEVNLKRLSATNQGDLLFDVRGTSGGVPMEANAPVLASATIPAASVSSGGFVSVDVRAFGISVATGQVLAVVLRAPGSGAFYRWLGSGSNTYARGTLYTRGTSSATWTNFGAGALDASFRTFVDTNPPAPNWIIADDFRSDGRLIQCVRWWGSYLNNATNGFQDGFVLSFFADIPVSGSNSFSRPGELLGTYIAPVSAVRAFHTGYLGWDSNAVYQYEVDLRDTCLDHAVANLATPTAFLERSNIIYWLAISAEVGHRISAVTNQAGLIVDWTATNTTKRATNHFWGWHTSPTNWNDASVMGNLTMSGSNWIYGNWVSNGIFHMELDQAFELLTTNRPAVVPIAEFLVITVTNTTSQPASDLHVLFGGATAAVYVDPLAVAALACPTPAVPSNGTTTNRVDIDWGGACVAVGETVTFLARASAAGLVVSNAFWSGGSGGTNIGAASAGVTRMPPSSDPLAALKIASVYVGGQTVYSPIYIINDGLCIAYWCWRLPRWCFSRVYFCPNANRFNRLIELPPWIPVTPWVHSAFSPLKCTYFEDTIRCPALGGRAVFGPPPNNPGPQNPHDMPKAPMEYGLSPRYSDDQGRTFRSGADFSSAFFAMHEAITIASTNQNTNAPPGPPPFPQFLQELGQGYPAAAAALTALIAEVDEVNALEPLPILGALSGDLQAMRSAVQGIGNQLNAGAVSNPAPFQAMSAACTSLAGHIRQLPSARFANPARNLDQVAVAFGCAADSVANGLNDPMEISAFVATLYVDFRTSLYHIATGMMPHMRVRMDVGAWTWYPSTIDAVEVRIQNRATGEMLDTELMGGMFNPLSNLGEFDIPLFTGEGTPLRLWIKMPTYLSRVVDVQAQDGLLIGPISSIPGDANGDNCVNALDLQMVQADQGKGRTEFPPTSDVNGDGVVDTEDLHIVQFYSGACGEELGAPAVGDLQAIGLQFTAVGANVYDVTPTLNVALSGRSIPAEWSLLVNGSPVGLDDKHKITSTACPAPPCNNEFCQIDVESMGMLGMVRGACKTDVTNCYCNATISLWAMHNVPIPPDAQVTLVLDPRNLLTELDESNNTLVTRLPPVLRIERGLSQVMLSWPVAFAGYGLEATDVLVPANWQGVTAPVVQVGGRFEVRVPLDRAMRFFRLRNPPPTSANFNCPPVFNLTMESGANPSCGCSAEPAYNRGISDVEGGCSDCSGNSSIAGMAQDTGRGIVFLHNGEMRLRAVDLEIPGRGFHWRFERTYRSGISFEGPLGHNWDFNYNRRLFVGANGDVTRVDGHGRADVYLRQVDGSYIAPRGFYTRLVRNLDGSLVERDRHGAEAVYSAANPKGLAQLVELRDRNNNRMQFQYDAQGRLARVIDTLSRPIDYRYDARSRLIEVEDFANRTLRFAYDANGNLMEATSPAVVGTPNGNDFPNGKTTRYSYSAGFGDERLNHNLLTVMAPNEVAGGGPPRLMAAYENNTASPDVDRIGQLMLGGVNASGVSAGGTMTYQYQILGVAPPNDFITAVFQNTVIDRNGNQTEYQFNQLGNVVRVREFSNRDVRAGDPAFYETRFEYNADGERTRAIYPEGNSVQYAYDTGNADRLQQGNLRIVTQLSGPRAGDQVFIQVLRTYEPSFNQVRTVTDARGNVTTHSYDANGNRTQTQHRIPSIGENWEYNAFGQVTAHILPDNGSGSRRRDEWTYHAMGPQTGYLRQQIVDVAGFALTQTYDYDAVGNVVRTVDPRGHDTLYTVNALNQVVRELSREVTDGSGIRYEKLTSYDANNNVVRTEIENRDEQGTLQANTHFTTAYEYDILEKVIRTTQEVEAGRDIRTEYGYDANENRIGTRFGEATSGADPFNTRTTVYDERDLTFQETRAQGSAVQSTTQHDYDRNGNLTQRSQGLESAPRNTLYVYDGYDRRVRTTDAMGNATVFNYDPNGNTSSNRVEGQLNDVPGSAGNLRLSETIYSYDAMDRRVRSDATFFDTQTQAAIDDGRSTTRTFYSDNSQVVRVLDDNNHPALTSYDTANRRLVVTDARSNTVSYAYDANNNVIRRIELDKSDSGPAFDETFTTQYAYDSLDRLIQTMDNVGNTHRYAYDSRNNRVVQNDARDNVTRYAYDGLNRLVQTTRFMTDTGEGTGTVIDTIITGQTWDDSSRLTMQVDDNGNATRYAYDSLDRRVSTTHADQTMSTDTYDVHDNRIQMNDSNGNLITSVYDLLNRVITRNVTRGVGVMGTTFENYQYDGLSRLTRAADDDSVVTRGYNSLSGITRETQQVLLGGPVRATISTRDGEGNLTRQVYPGGGQTNVWTYDNLDRPLLVRNDPPGPSPFIAIYSYIGATRMERRDYGNGTREEVLYDGARRVRNTRHSRISDGFVIDNRDYAWDPMDNKAFLLNINNPAQSVNYHYDSVNRLVQSDWGSGSPVRYLLDGAGNRNQVIGGPDAGVYNCNPVQPEPADCQMNQYTATPYGQHTYDRNGNQRMAASGILQGSYDYRNQLVQFQNMALSQSITYKYDCLGRRIERNLNGVITRFYHDRWQEIEEQNSANVTVGTYIYSQGTRLQMSRSGQIYFYHADDLGSVMKVTDLTGNVVEFYAYYDYGKPSFFDQFGNPISGSQIGNPYLFKEYRLEHSGLYWCSGGDLSPELGRYVERLADGAWGSAMNLGNAYSYAANNPASTVAAICPYCGGCSGCGHKPDCPLNNPPPPPPPPPPPTTTFEEVLGFAPHAGDRIVFYGGRYIDSPLIPGSTSSDSHVPNPWTPSQSTLMPQRHGRPCAPRAVVGAMAVKCCEYSCISRVEESPFKNWRTRRGRFWFRADFMFDVRTTCPEETIIGSCYCTHVVDPSDCDVMHWGNTCFD